MAIYILPCFVLFIFLYGIYKKIDVYNEFIIGVKSGLETCKSLLPNIMVLVCFITIFKNGGILNVIISLLNPLLVKFNFPPEILPLVILRPFSGSGALSEIANLFAMYGADSKIGYMASIISGSSETTFYAFAVYFGATKVKDTGKLIYICLISDLICVFISYILTIKIS